MVVAQPDTTSSGAIRIISALAVMIFLQLSSASFTGHVTPREGDYAAVFGLKRRRAQPIARPVGAGPVFRHWVFDFQNCGSGFGTIKPQKLRGGANVHRTFAITPPNPWSGARRRGRT